MAAEGTLPGDVLYPVKLVTEQVRSVFDPAVVAEHRLDEVERMLERDVPLERVVDHLQVADRSLSTLPDHDELDRRFDRVVDLVRDRVGPDRIPGDQFPRHHTDRTIVTDTPPGDGPADRDGTDAPDDRTTYDREVGEQELDVPQDADIDSDTAALIHDGTDMPGDGGGMIHPGG